MKKGTEKEYRDALIRLTAIRELWMHEIEKVRHLMPKELFRVKNEYVSNYMFKVIDRLEERGGKYYESIFEWSMCWRNQKSRQYRFTKMGYWFSPIENEPENKQRVLVSMGYGVHVSKYEDSIFKLFDRKTGKWIPSPLDIDAWTYCPKSLAEIGGWDKNEYQFESDN